jgi:hypothetical protein
MHTNERLLYPPRSLPGLRPRCETMPLAPVVLLRCHFSTEQWTWLVAEPQFKKAVKTLFSANDVARVAFLGVNLIDLAQQGLLRTNNPPPPAAPVLSKKRDGRRGPLPIIGRRPERLWA